VRDLRDEAVVLRTYKSGEADRVLVIYTREHGKLRALAKGVRKPTTKIGGFLEPLAHVSLFLAESRTGLHIVRQAEMISRWPGLRADYERLTAGLAIVEAVDATPAEGTSDTEVYDMLVRTLQTLDDPRYHPMLVPAAFYLKLLIHDGSEPVLSECVSCGRAAPLVAFDAAIGGTLCDTCRQGRPLSPAALALLRRMFGGELGSVLTEGQPEAAGEVATLAAESLEQHFGRRLKVPRSQGSS
jgi:DNA repair protein RecO (recombination protein O)